MLKIAIIDADLIGRKRHRFPNLACMKLSGYWKERRADVVLMGTGRFELLFRIEVLMRYRCLPYVMRYARYAESPYRGMYITLARWCNQPGFFKKKSLWEFAESNGRNSACFRYVDEFTAQFPEVERYLHLKFGGSV